MEQSSEPLSSLALSIFLEQFKALNEQTLESIRAYMVRLEDVVSDMDVISEQLQEVFTMNINKEMT